MTIVHLMQRNVPGLVRNAVKKHEHHLPDARECTWTCEGCSQHNPCFLNVQDTMTMTMTIVHLMQGNVPGLVKDAVTITLAF
jgi:hypothetical protein